MLVLVALGVTVATSPATEHRSAQVDLPSLELANGTAAVELALEVDATGDTTHWSQRSIIVDAVADRGTVLVELVDEDDHATATDAGTASDPIRVERYRSCRGEGCRADATLRIRRVDGGDASITLTGRVELGAESSDEDVPMPDLELRVGAPRRLTATELEQRAPLLRGPDLHTTDTGRHAAVRLAMDGVDCDDGTWPTLVRLPSSQPLELTTVDRCEDGHLERWLVAAERSWGPSVGTTPWGLLVTPEVLATATIHPADVTTSSLPAVPVGPQPADLGVVDRPVGSPSLHLVDPVMANGEPSREAGMRWARARFGDDQGGADGFVGPCPPGSCPSQLVVQVWASPPEHEAETTEGLLVGAVVTHLVAP